jgi:hypothetical protein
VGPAQPSGRRHDVEQLGVVRPKHGERVVLGRGLALQDAGGELGERHGVLLAVEVRTCSVASRTAFRLG